MSPDRDEALKYLRWNWGEVYLITEAGGVWRAVRVGRRGRALTAPCADELRAAIIADYCADPVRQNRVMKDASFISRATMPDDDYDVCPDCGYWPCIDEGDEGEPCFNCGEPGCPGYCDDHQTYNLRPGETGGDR